MAEDAETHIRAAVAHPDGLKRCPWPGADPLYLAYHDEEWGAPEWDDRALYEKLVLDGFQAGLAWITILRKRPAFRLAFDGFDPEKVARYDERKIAALLGDAGIVRHRGKIEATIALARVTLDLQGRGRAGQALVELRRRPADRRQAPLEPRRPGRKPGIAGDVEGFEGARGALRRPDDRLRLHAGDRHGQRPSGRLPPPRRLPRARRGAPAMTGAAKPRAEIKPRAWQRMLSGRRLDLIDPSPLDVEIADIAHGLARVARWNGQTSGAEIFSVAQHSLLVEALFAAEAPAPPRAARLAALLHDAPEYVIGDMISPFKAAIGGDYKRVELRLMAAILVRFGLPAEPTPELAKAIKAADRVAAYLEATALAGFTVAEARKFFGAPKLALKGFAGYLRPQRPAEAQAAFLARFAELDQLAHR